MLVGICGAHRTGKTTLCEKFVEECGGYFMKTNASEVFKKLNMNPQGEYPLDVVLDIQEAILGHFEGIWEMAYKLSGDEDVVTDRTPLDLIAYLMAHVTQTNLTDENEDRIIDYVERCQNILEKYFMAIVVISPGIDLFQDETKAIANPIYISYIHRLIMGSIFIDAAGVNVYRIPSHITDIDERIDYVQGVCEDIRRSYKKSLRHVVKH